MNLQTVKKCIKNPVKIITGLAARGFLNWVPDKTYVKTVYRMKMGKKLDLENPQTFNEKLQWVKLYDRKPVYTRMVDKYEAKGWIAEQVGEEYVIPTIGVWDSFDQIDKNALPNEFIMKTTHDSGTFMICTDKSTFNWELAKKRMEKSLRRTYFYSGREWPYKNVKPRIICEELLKNEDGKPLSDYKFYCFNGDVRMSHVTFGRGTEEGLRVNYYDRDLNLLPVQHYKYPPYKGEYIPPKNYEKMVELASVLSKDTPHVRVDFYEVNDKIYLGELTFFTDGGCGYFTPREFDYTVGSWMKLPKEEK